jgi:hypothetical protein
MFKLRMSALVLTGLLALVGGAGSALASSGGDSNSGDVWLDNVGQPAGPGHEMDPHLACQDINMWGAGMADGSGTFTIDGWPPSGSKEVDYSGDWSYDTTQGGDQVVATISIDSLIATAQSNGDSPAHNGYHFKLDFVQDPQKHKTFWVDCPASFTPSVATSSNQKSSNRPKPTTRAGHRTRHRTTSRTRHRTTTRTHRRRHHRRHRISRRARSPRGFTG